MRVLGLVALSLILEGCDFSSSQSGRYQQISNPRPADCIVVDAAKADKEYFDQLLKGPPSGKPFSGYCGMTILDTQTGTIFTRDLDSWHEENPHTGKTENHRVN
jgi:hypothetical protein